MSTAYWAQWSHAEIDALHGIEEVLSSSDNDEDEAGHVASEPLYMRALTPFDIDGLTYRDFL